MSEKNINRCIEIYNELFSEYYGIFTNNIDVKNNNINKLQKELKNIHSDFTNELKNIKHYDIEQAKIFVLDYYVYGIYNLKCKVSKFIKDNIKSKKTKILNDINIDIMNFQYSINELCIIFKETITKSFEIPQIDCSKYNIKGKYFENFDIDKKIKFDYTKHPSNLLAYPKELITEYKKYYNYEIETGFFVCPFYLDNVPLSNIILNGLDVLKINRDTIPLTEYKKGFIKGYNTDLRPFVDTPQTRKENILLLINNTKYGFKINVKTKEFDLQNVYEVGFIEGKKYKVWEYIFQTPSILLEQLKTKKTKPKELPLKEKYDNINMTFEYLFIDKENAKKLKDLLETTHYIDEDNNWIYGGVKYNLAKIYYILKKETQILKQQPASKQLPIFYKEFKITEYTMNNLYSANKYLYIQEQKEHDQFYKNFKKKLKEYLPNLLQSITIL